MDLKRINQMIKTIRNGKNIELFVAVLIIGIILSIAGSLFFDKDKPKLGSIQFEEQKHLNSDASESYSQVTYIEQLEKRLEVILSQIRGVGEVAVMITYEAGPEIVTAKEVNESINTTEENDTHGGNRVLRQETKNEKAVTVSKQGETQPVIIKEKMPKVQGVIIVAEGAHSVEVKAELIESVKTILDLPSHKVRVCLKKD